MLNPWVSGQLTDQHLAELYADAAAARRSGRKPRRRTSRARQFAARMHLPVRGAIGCEA